MWQTRPPLLPCVPPNIQRESHCSRGILFFLFVFIMESSCFLEMGSLLQTVNYLRQLRPSPGWEIKIRTWAECWDLSIQAVCYLVHDALLLFGSQTLRCDHFCLFLFCCCCWKKTKKTQNFHLLAAFNKLLANKHKIFRLLQHAHTHTHRSLHTLWLGR